MKRSIRLSFIRSLNLRSDPEAHSDFANLYVGGIEQWDTPHSKLLNQVFATLHILTRLLRPIY